LSILFYFHPSRLVNKDLMEFTTRDMHTQVVKTMKKQVKKFFELLISKLQSHFSHMMFLKFQGWFSFNIKWL
jgi:hypothetical protein